VEALSLGSAKTLLFQFVSFLLAEAGLIVWSGLGYLVSEVPANTFDLKVFVARVLGFLGPFLADSCTIAV
jgi:hypothetical protein